MHTILENVKKDATSDGTDVCDTTKKYLLPMGGMETIHAFRKVQLEGTVKQRKVSV